MDMKEKITLIKQHLNFDQLLLDLQKSYIEMMADDLYVAITKKYPGRKIEIDVSEDGENGSHAIYERA